MTARWCVRWSETDSRCTATTTSRCGSIPASRQRRTRPTAPWRRWSSRVSDSASPCSGIRRPPTTPGCSTPSSRPPQPPRRTAEAARVAQAAESRNAAANPITVSTPTNWPACSTASGSIVSASMVRIAPAAKAWITAIRAGSAPASSP